VKQRSLTRQLIVTVLAAELLCAIALSGVALFHEQHERFRDFDVMLRGRADSLLGAVQDAEDPGDNVMVDGTELVVPLEDAYEIIDESGRILGRSPLWNAGFQVPLTNGYGNQHVGGIRYRVLRAAGVRVIDREENGGIRRPVLLIYAAPTHRLWQSIFEAVRFSILTGLLLLALTGAFLVWFLRKALLPLRELATEAGKITAHSWDFHPSQEALRTKELEPLATSMTQLLRGLKAAFAQQQRFTSDAAHELKTALAVIKSSLQLLTLRPRTSGEYAAGLERSIEDTERMEGLVSRMLTLARVEEREGDTPASSDLAASLMRAVHNLEPLATLRGVEVMVTASTDLFVCLSEEDGDILCSNLLSNAIQYSETKSSVLATARLTAGGIELTVTDYGEGIPEESLPHLFERFFRADTSRARHTGGSGLGLSICGAIVTNARGSIRIGSVLGQGTQVTVALGML
jgi:signal transduction histidine kinase